MKPGELVAGRFELLEPLGVGATASAWRARDQVDDSELAIKVLHPHLAGNEAVVERFRREVRAARRLRHPGAVRVFDLHERDGDVLLSMELMPGGSLAAAYRLDEARVLELGCALAQTLAAAHEAGLVHRDVKPDNVLLDGDGQPHLVDFGMSRVAHEAAATQSAQALGSAGYTAPEVYRGVSGDPRSDLYGLGAVLYRLLEGRPPYEGPSPYALMRAQLEEDPAPPDASPALARYVMALLRRDPDERPLSADQVAADLELLAQGGRPVLPTAPESSPSSPGLPGWLGDPREHANWRVLVLGPDGWTDSAGPLKRRSAKRIRRHLRRQGHVARRVRTHVSWLDRARLLLFCLPFFLVLPRLTAVFTVLLLLAQTRRYRWPRRLPLPPQRELPIPAQPVRLGGTLVMGGGLLAVLLVLGGVAGVAFPPLGALELIGLSLVLGSLALGGLSARWGQSSLEG